MHYRRKVEIDRKLMALDRIYAVYDEFVRVQDTACKMHCHQCCTTHVTLTTLEAFKICETLPSIRLRLILPASTASIARIRTPMRSAARSGPSGPGRTAGSPRRSCR